MLASRSRKFLSYYKPYRGLLIADLACAFMVSAITLVLPLCAQYITKNVLAGQIADPMRHITLMGALMVVLVLMHTLCESFVDYQGHMMGAKMESDMRMELFEHYQRLPFRFYDDHRTGQLMTRLTNDIFWLSELYHHGPEDLAIALFKFAGVFALLWSIDVRLTLILFAFLPVMGGYAFYFNRHMNRALAISKERIGEINAQVEDSLGGIRVVQSFGNERLETATFSALNQRFLDSRRYGYKNETYFSNGISAFTQFITLAVIGFGSMSILNHTLDLADLVTYLLCIGILIEPIQRAVNFARLYQEGITGFNRFMEVLEVQPAIQDAPDAVDLSTVDGGIEFQRVSFRYHEDHNHVINDISFRIQPGEYVALVGPSGVGKTTLLSLIPRFYEVSEGSILIDGKDIREVTLHSLRRNIGVVQQDVYLFAGTVAENIRYGRPDATHDEIMQAAKQANAHEFITALPHGYDTDIGQRGVKLSGGQKQRLSIARVFLKNPPILIFDEATSSLDNESERAVQDSLETLTAHRTTLVIAHRLSTVRNAQRIIVLTEQGIEEQGTHEQLIALDGTYAALYQWQLEI